MLQCADGTFYIGKTVNLPKRIRQHNGEIKGGAIYTRTRRPVKVVFQEVYETNQEACLREYNLKQLTREEKQELIKR
jgi:putative endonuclease